MSPLIKRRKVTLGVCIRNSASTIKETIRSIICQDYPHDLIEVIFVDDGSEDATLLIIKEHIPMMDMQVKVFHQEWKGIGFSRNIVVNNAEGDYIVWVDGDMILPKNHVRIQVEFMEQNLDVGIAKARYGLITEENIIATLENLSFVISYLQNETSNSMLPGTGGAIYRVEAIRQIGGFDNRLKEAGEDVDAAYRIKMAGWNLRVSPAFFYEKSRRTWLELWKRYFKHGYSSYYLYSKNKNVFSLLRMSPPASFIKGILFIPDAYRLIHRKSVLLLPFHFLFKMSAWFTGFTISKIKSSNA